MEALAEAETDTEAWHGEQPESSHPRKEPICSAAECPATINAGVPIWLFCLACGAREALDRSS